MGIGFLNLNLPPIVTKKKIMYPRKKDYWVENFS